MSSSEAPNANGAVGGDKTKPPPPTNASQARRSNGSTSGRTGSDSMNWRSNHVVQQANNGQQKKPLKTTNKQHHSSTASRGSDAQGKARTNSYTADGVARILSENNPKTHSSVSEISNDDYDCDSDPSKLLLFSNNRAAFSAHNTQSVSDNGSGGENSPGGASQAGDRVETLSEMRDSVLDLDEAFSDSEGEDSSSKQVVVRPRLNLPLPRGRIRTLSGTVPPVGYAPVFGGATMCLQCMEFFDLPKQTAKYVEHLIDVHQIVVTDIELIVDLKRCVVCEARVTYSRRYIEHWRARLGKSSVDSVFPKVTPATDDPLHGQVECYHVMSDTLKEDKRLREKLAMRRLEEVLSCQQRERQDNLFTQQCLFCRYVARGNRAKLIHHLYMIHHLNLGSPDNLVFVAEYLDLLREKITAFECIYCEKSFGDHPQLMEHMRKRGHREVNPKNNYYDKFYIINYLELGKKWLDVLAEDFEDQTPHFADSDDEDEERDGWAEWERNDCDDECECMSVCLMCDTAKDDIDALLEHMKTEHVYDLVEVVREHKMTFYDRIKFINYVRRACHTCVCWACGRDDLHSWPALRKHMADGNHASKIMPARELWCTDENLISMFDNDHMLWMLQSHLESRALGPIEAGDEDAQPSEEAEAKLRAMSIAHSSDPSGPWRPPVTACPLLVIKDSELANDPELVKSLK